MTVLFHAHSGLRYLVLLAGLFAFVWFLYGWIGRRPWRAPAPAALAAFIGVLDLQALLGIVMWLGGRTAAGIVEHLVLMLGAVVAVHLASIVHRRRARLGFGLPLLGVTVALVLVTLGIQALGRPVV